MQRLIKVFTSRLVMVAVLILLQMMFFVLVLYQTAMAFQFFWLIQLIGFFMVIYIINLQEEPYFKIAWSITVLVLPILGVPLYLVAGNKKVPKKIRNGTIRASKHVSDILEKDHELLDQITEADPVHGSIFRYGMNRCGFPVYQGTRARYYSSGEEWKPEFLNQLRKAKHFIFMEYFIIDEGKFWDEILAILKQKAMEGVTVKLIYDDFGCVTLPRHYDRKLKEYGIEAFRFNKLRPALIVQMNNRDHRKICVIDNRVAFTGGVNLADEYVNLIKRFGYWKDSAIMIQGKAVWSFTVMFLGMYSYLKGDDTLDYLQYKLPADDIPGTGCFLPFSDSPTDNEHTCLGMHLNIVNHAADYIYIDTPYLILNESMTTSLILAAKNGVDVRILLPHIPDKVITNQITKGNYAPLIRAGVRIYEYTPGFNHAKNILADDKIGLVGSINTDYRSYYLHFEDGIILSDKAVISKMKQDFLDSIAKSKEITIDDISRTRLPVRLFRGSLKAFMPLF